MSKSFGKLFTYLDIALYKNICCIENKNKLNLNAKIILLSTLTSFHCAYALNTSITEKIKIVKKYKMVRNGYTDFMVIDNKNRHFNVNNSLWYWKWNSIEDWSNIKEGNEINLKYYGWRVPLLGLFPNIYTSSNENFLNSTSKTSLIEFHSEIINIL